MTVVHTQLDLYRAGNATSARFDRVRPQDVVIWRTGTGDWVVARSGGVSTFDRPQGLSGPWYRLPRGAAYDDATFHLSNPHPGRWKWEPARDMPLADYIAALAALNQTFVRMP